MCTCQLEAAPVSFTTETTVLPDALFTASTVLGSCDAEKIDAFMQEQLKSKSAYVQVNSAFLVGTCLFYQVYRTADEAAADEAAADEAAAQSALAALQKAQLGGLHAPQQNLAVLYEGLLHVLLARRAMPSDSGEAQSLDKRSRFCAHRAMASAAFADANWAAVSLGYETPQDKPTLESLVSDMARAYESSNTTGGVLSSARDSVCAINTPSEGEDFTKSIRDALKPIQKEYLGPTGPIGGMFARKIEKTQGAFDSAKTQIDTLETASKNVSDTFRTYHDNFSPVREEIAQVVARYKDAIILANRIIDEHKKWQDGLWWEERKTNGQPVKTDVKALFNKAVDTFNTSVAPLGFSGSPPADDSVLAKTKASVQTMLSAFQDPEQDKQTVRAICSVYFCHIKTPILWRHFQEVCHTGGKTSLLCDTQKDDELASMCKDAGFTDIPTLLTHPEDTPACMAKYRNEYSVSQARDMP
jgi:hypothetical protein